MLYLYTVMMVAWDLDPATHSHFRGFLDVFINKRKISKDLREFVLNARSRVITWHCRPDINLPSSTFNELRISLPYRVFTESQRFRSYYSDAEAVEVLGESPNLIEDIHPPKYYYEEEEIY